MSEAGNHERVLQNLKNYIVETKLLIEKVMKMRIQCKEIQMTLLRLFNPKCIKILEITNELSHQGTVQYVNKNGKIKTKFFDLKK